MNAAYKSTETRWRLDGWHVVADDSTQQRVYVRDLIDWGSYEFVHCKFSYRERLQIIESVGEETILSVMVEIAEAKQRPYRIEDQGIFDLDLLRKFSLMEGGALKSKIVSLSDLDIFGKSLSVPVYQ